MDGDRCNELIELRDAVHIAEASGELTKLVDAQRDPVVRAVIVMAVAKGFSWQKRFSDARLTLNHAATMVGSNHVSYPRLLLAIAVVDIKEENWKAALKKLDKIVRQPAVALNTENNRVVFEEIQRNRGIALFVLRRVYRCRVLNLESDASRSSQMLERSHLGR